MSKWPKIIKFILVATLILPLVYTQWTIYPSHFGKTVFFQMIVAVLALAAYYHLIVRRREFVRLQVVDWLLLAFVGSSLLSSALGVEWNRSFWGDQSRVQGVFTLIHFTAFYFLLRAFFRSRQEWYRLLAVVLAVSAVSSLVAWIGTITPALKAYVPAGRLSGLIGNPIFFANYLILPIFLSFFCYFYFSEKRGRRLWLAIGVLNIITLLASQTRGPFIGFMAGAVLAVLLILFLAASRRVKITGAVSVGFILLILALGYLAPSVQEIFPETWRAPFSISLRQATAQTRLMAWRIALQGWRQYPVFGAGPESFQDTFDRHYDPRFLRFSLAETVWDQPHNYPLEILSSRGLVGFGIYLAIIASILVVLWRIIRQAEEQHRRLAAIFLFAAIIGYVVALTFSFETSNSWQLWFAFLALVVWLRFGDSGSEPVHARRFLVKAGFAVLIFLAASSLFYGYRMLKSSYYTSYARDAALLQSTYLWQEYAEKAIIVPAPFQWEQAFFLTKDMAILDGSGNLDKEATSAIGPKIEQVFLKYLVKKPETYLYKFWLSQAYAFMGEFVDRSYFAKAEKELRQTWAINRYRQVVPFLLSKTYFIQGKTEESIAVLREVAAQDPTLPQPHWFLGINLVSAGKLAEGAEELTAGADFGISNRQNTLYLIDVYAQLKKYDKIVPLYQRLIEFEPANFSYYASLAATYAALGNKPEAKAFIKKAVELNPELSAEAEQFIKDKGLRKK